MNWLMRGLSSSVGKKFIVGSMGLLLCVFLVVHLGGNLLLYRGPGAYDAYAEALHKQEWLVKLAEAGLVVLFGLHIVVSLWTTKQNRGARPDDYALRRAKVENRSIPLAPSYWMLGTGLIVLVFLIVHLGDFTWNLWHQPPDQDVLPFQKALYIMNQPVSFWLYVVGSVLLGVHLAHGFGSAFRSVGVRHPKYTPLIWWFGVIFAVAMGLGFLSFPIWAKFYAASM